MGEQMPTELEKICVLEYLAHIKEGRLAVDAACERIKVLRSRLDARGPVYSQAPKQKATKPDAGADMVLDFIEAQEDLATVLEDRLGDELAAFSLFHRPGEIYASLLWAHYVEGQTWRQVGRRYGYAEKTAIRAAMRGVVCVYADIPQEWKNVPKAL